MLPALLPAYCCTQPTSPHLLSSSLPHLMYVGGVSVICDVLDDCFVPGCYRCQDS